jgi:transposase
MDPQCSPCNGRPTPATPGKTSAWQIQARVQPDHEPLEHQQHLNACVVGGTKSAMRQLSDAAVMRAYQGQVQAERGVRLLNEPLCCVSSLLVQKPSRVQGLRMVMTMALLV